MDGIDTINTNTIKARTVPKSAIISFFECAALKLNQYGTNGKLQISLTEPFLLDELRNQLLELQKAALEEAVVEYNKTLKDTYNYAEPLLTTCDVQVELENLGNIYARNCKSEDGEAEEIFQAIKRMNEAERLALARGVLATQWTYLDDFDDDDGSGGIVAVPSDGVDENTVLLEGQDILDYFNLCVTIAGMEEFSQYIKTGAPLVAASKFHPQGFDVNTGEEKNVDKYQLEHLAPEKRLILVQQVVLRAVLGYPVLDPSVVVAEANRLLSLSTNNERDCREKKLRDAYEAYTSAMRLAYCACW